MSDSRLLDSRDLKFSRRQSLRLLGGAGAALALPGVAGAAAAGGRPLASARLLRQGEPVAGGSVTAVTEADWVDLDPHTNALFASMQAWEYVYESLVQVDADLNPIPALAESWETPDSQTYVFHLRQGVSWHDGRPFVAEDVKYSFERVLNPDTGAPQRSSLGPITSIDILDDQTVQISLSEPRGFYLETLANLLGTAIIPTGAAEERDLKNDPNGTGPFRVAEIRTGDYIRYERNPDYWDAPLPYLDELILKLMVEEDTRVAWIRGEQADYIDLYPEAAARLDGEEGIVVIQHPKVYMMRVIYDCGTGPTSDARVRRALDMSLDRFDMIDKARFGGATLTGYVPSGFGEWAIPDDQLPAYFTTPEIEGATALLAEAGYADGFKTTIRGSRPEHIAIALVAQQNWKEIGVDAEVVQMEYGTYIEDYLATNFETIVVGQTFTPDPLNYLWPIFHSEGAANRNSYSNPTVDDLLDRASQTTDREELKQLLDEAQQFMWQDGAPHSYVYNAFNFEGLRERVKGYYPLFSARRTAMKQVWIEE